MRRHFAIFGRFAVPGSSFGCPRASILATTETITDSSRLLLPELFAECNLQGDPVVMFPIRGSLLIAGADEANALTEMAKAACQMMSMPHFWSGMPMRLVNGTWTTYQPAPDHPATAFVARPRTSFTVA